MLSGTEMDSLLTDVGTKLQERQLLMQVWKSFSVEGNSTAFKMHIKKDKSKAVRIWIFRFKD